MVQDHSTSQSQPFQMLQTAVFPSIVSIQPHGKDQDWFKNYFLTHVGALFHTYLQVNFQVLGLSKLLESLMCMKAIKGH